MKIGFFSFFLIILIFISCKKEDELSMFLSEKTSFSSLKKEIPISKTVPFENKDFQYAYADLCVLNNKLLIVAVKFHKVGDLEDFSEIVLSESNDNGESWSKPITIINNMAAINISMPNFILFSQSHLALVFLAKESHDTSNLLITESFDGGLSWSKPRFIVKNSGYNIINNGVVRYIDNTIYLPIAHVFGNIYSNYGKQEVYYYKSEDRGQTWTKSKSIANLPIPLMEPTINKLNNLDFLINIRTKEGFIYFARKIHDSHKWQIYNTGIPSSESPATIHTLDNNAELYMVWNRVNKLKSNGKAIRSPLSIAKSKDNGYSWIHFMDLENNDDFDYSYTSVRSNSDYLYLCYYEMDTQKNKGKSKIVFVRLKKNDLDII